MGKEPDAFARLPALAERLGVEPISTSSKVGARYLVCTGTGEQRRCYDFFDLANAFLDRIDITSD